MYGVCVAVPHPSHTAKHPRIAPSVYIHISIWPLLTRIYPFSTIQVARKEEFWKPICQQLLPVCAENDAGALLKCVVVHIYIHIHIYLYIHIFIFINICMYPGCRPSSSGRHNHTMHTCDTTRRIDKTKQGPKGAGWLLRADSGLRPVLHRVPPLHGRRGLVCPCIKYMLCMFVLNMCTYTWTCVCKPIDPPVPHQHNKIVFWSVRLFFRDHLSLNHKHVLNSATTPLN